MTLPFFNFIKYLGWIPKKEIEPIKTQTMSQDDITIKRIEKSHPKIREQLKADYLECNNKILGKGVRLRFAQVLRTIAEQEAIYNQGRTTSGPIVTNAKAGQSIHNYGLAFDIVILYDKDGNGTFETASWERNKDWKDVVNFFKSKGYDWGGDWRSRKDYPHFDKTFGYTWRNLINMKKDKNGYPIL